MILWDVNYLFFIVQNIFIIIIYFEILFNNLNHIYIYMLLHKKKKKNTVYSMNL